MIVRGLTREELEHVARNLPWGSMKLYELNQIDQRGKAFRFSLRAFTSIDRYARLSASGRHGPWACYHAYRDFHRALFKAGAFSINTNAPGHRGMTGRRTFHSVEEFNATLLAYAEVNIGSPMSPVSYIDLCDDDYYAGHGLKVTEYAIIPKEA